MLMAPDMGKQPIMAGLLALDAILLKVSGLPRGLVGEAVFRSMEHRLFQMLGRTFMRRAKRGIASALKEIDAKPADKQMTQGEVDGVLSRLRAAFDGWDDEMMPIIDAVTAEAYRAGKTQLWQKGNGLLRRKLEADSPHLTARMMKAAGDIPLEIKPAFGLKDDQAIKALSDKQTFWIGQHYSENLSSRISAVTRDIMLDRGLGRREAGPLLQQALEAEFGLDPLAELQRAGLSIPKGWKGTSPQYFEMLAANTVVNGRVQGSMRAMTEIGVTTYEIVNPIDERTCERCKFMDGKKFSTVDAQSRMERETSAKNPESVKQIHPWASSAGELRSRSDSKLMADGFAYPPFHARCRCTVDISTTAIEPEKPAALDFGDKHRGGYDWGYDKFENWWSGLSDDEIEAFNAYKGAGYANINGLLRFGSVGADAQVVAETEKLIASMDSALGKGTIPETVKVSRVLGVDDLNSVSVGETVHDLGYSSTTMSKEVRDKFARKNLIRGKNPVALEFEIPAGTRAGFADMTAPGFELSENEIILPRGAKFVITSVEDIAVADPSGLLPARARGRKMRIARARLVMPSIPEAAAVETFSEARLLSEGKVVKTEAMGTKGKKGANVAKLVTVEGPDGKQIKGVFKPATGEMKGLRKNIKAGTFYKREVAASRVSRVMGVDDLLPTTVERTVGGEVGSFQAFSDVKAPKDFVFGAGPPPGSGIQVKHLQLDREASERMRVFDYVTGNQDRHAKNVLYHMKEGKLMPVMIDHGLSFPVGPAADGFIQPVSMIEAHKGELLESTKKLLSSIDGEELAKLLHESGIEPDAIRHSLRRLDGLKKAPSRIEITSDKHYQWMDIAGEDKQGLDDKELGKIDELVKRITGG